MFLIVRQDKEKVWKALPHSVVDVFRTEGGSLAPLLVPLAYIPIPSHLDFSNIMHIS